MVGLIPWVFALCAVLTTVAPAALPDAAGWWRLDGNAEDSSGNENHGTLVGDPSWVEGMFGGAILLDGVDDKVNCGNGPSLNITGPITISAWIYPTGPGSTTYPRVVDKSNGTGGADPGYKLYMRSGENYIFTLSAGGTYFNSTLSAAVDTWNYVAFVITGTQWRLCVNGTWQEWSRTELPSSSTNPLNLGDGPAGARPFAGMLDDVRVYNMALTNREIQDVMQGPLPPGMASKPVPEVGTTDVRRDPTLTWTPAEDVAETDGHIVYLSKDFADVNDGVGGVPQSAPSYAPEPLDFGTTYYWRVDEVPATPGSATLKGQVWSFTVEPYAYPISAVTATASSAQTDMGPENTVNGSGLDADNLHSVTPEEMWLSAGAAPDWIAYEFDRAHKLHEMWVWNSNQLLETTMGFGAKDVTVEYSLDGATWTALDRAPQFARATSEAGYAHNTVVPFGGVFARFVKLTIDATWGGMGLVGLSEVRFLAVPVQAREPEPGDAATGLPLDATLSWRPGRDAVSHTVYLAKDRDAVAQGTAPATGVTDHRFAPSDLEFGATYYWRVDEVNEAQTPGVHEGPVWSFRTQDYTTVDDFESYTDQEGSRIYESWPDGYGTTTNGSQVGHIEAPFAEQIIVHGDKQSMPLLFSNSGTVTVSEAELTLSPARDWTIGGVKTLSLWLYGDPENTGGQLYVKVNGVKVAYDGDPADLAVAGWRPWSISLASFSTNLKKVTSVVIGVEGAGASGRFFIDDIRLYPHDRNLVTPVEPDPAGLVAYYKFEKDGADSSGNNNHGTVIGNPSWVPGKVGNAVNLDGGHDYIDCGNSPSLNLNGPMTIVAWMYPTGPGGGGFGRLLDKSSGTGSTDPGYKIYHRSTENYILTLSVGGGDHRSPSGLNLDAWNFFGFIVTGTQWRLCLNGAWQEWDETAVPTVVENPLYIGSGSTAARNFQGMLDEIRIYNRALTTGEMAWLSGRTTPFDMPM
jgi:hypothetical protein